MIGKIAALGIDLRGGVMKSILVLFWCWQQLLTVRPSPPEPEGPWQMQLQSSGPCPRHWRRSSGHVCSTVNSAWTDHSGALVKEIGWNPDQWPGTIEHVSQLWTKTTKCPQVVNPSKETIFLEKNIVIGMDLVFCTEICNTPFSMETILQYV